MEAREPSFTAIIAGMSRAAHLYVDDEPKILRDELALGLSGHEDKAGLLAALEKVFAVAAEKTSPEFASNFYQSYRAFAVMLHLYTEDELEKALARGVSQYVILGAGLDSFAYRRPDLEGRLRVFEVDHPASQEWKKARLKALHIKLPRNLTFVPVDFEKQALMNELEIHGYRKEATAFISWLGVTQYLTEAAVFQTLRDVSSAAPGSEIVFEYVLDESLLVDGDRLFITGGRQQPEPWISFFDPQDLAERVRQTGFKEVADFGPDEANRLYFAGRSDELSVSVLDNLTSSTLRIAHLMKAMV